MSRMRFFVCGVIIFLLGLGMGAYAGYRWIGKPSRAIDGLAARAYASQLSILQYHEADYDTAKASLENYLALLAEPGIANALLFDSKVSSVEQGLALGRLALLNEKANKPDVARVYLAKSAENFRLAGWENVSKEHLESAINRFDDLWDASHSNKAR